MSIVKSVVDRLWSGADRPDGELIRTHPYRRIMAHIMPGRNEAVVYYDTYARAEKLLKYIEEARARFHCDITHCLVGAVAIGLTQNPRMNRFVVGRRLYQRKERWITFSMKRQKMGRRAKLSVVKLKMDETETFEGLCRRIGGEVKVERSKKKTYMDKELNLLDFFPRTVLDWGVGVLKGLDHFNVLPASFIDRDGMYTSMFIANLGSLGMSPGYHHLYEWGNCPLFMMVGKIEKRPIVVEGDKIEVQQVIPIRWSYDERIDDGLNANYGIQAVNTILEDPYHWFGCLAEDGSDQKPLKDDEIR